jgi:hypothetical protein
MRKLLLTLLLVPLLSRPAVDPSPGIAPPPRRLPAFPLPLDFASSSRGVGESALLIPLDTRADAFKLTSVDAGVAFDIDGDGDRDQIAWPEAGSEVAFLALDVDRDGRITSGKEIFGSHMRPDAKNGCNALIQAFMTSEGALSGAVHEGHMLYEQLLLWVDRNHNGISERAELRRARDVFTAIGMGFTKVGWRDEHGNRVRYEGWTELRTGGPEQQRAIDLAEQQRRLRHDYEVVVLTIQ